nr:ABC transporter ATP-binding protein [uncultured Desulfobulbus sp.]
MNSSTEAIIRLEGIGKSFGEVRANRNISLSMQRGSILALLGENGAGKSTLMSILAGQLQPDSGRILLNGEPTLLSSTEAAIKCGIGMVYQHFKLVEAMSVAENVLLGQSGGFWIKPKRMQRQVAELISQYGMSIRPEALVAELSMGEKQQVEILRLLYRQSDILIFDEPTAVLTPLESEHLFTAMRRMRDRGKALVFISHKLEEVLAVADRIAILKQGEVIDQMAVHEIASTAELAQRMVGRPVLLTVERKWIEPRQTVLQVDNLSGDGLTSVYLELRQGEVFGLVGVAGNGQKQLVETICGLRRPGEGTVRLLGKAWAEFFRDRDPDRVLSYIPEDRQGLATCPELDLLDNFLLTTREDFYRGPWLRRSRARTKAQELMRTFDIRPADLRSQARQLSGGNLQKLVLAREFSRKPWLIVAEQPTQGLDIAAAEDVWQLLMEAREQAGILLVTGDLAEALALSDRIGVMFGGALLGIIERDDEQGIENIAQLMAGLTSPAVDNDQAEEGL